MVESLNNGVYQPKNVIVTDDGKKYQKADMAKVALGATAGGVVNGVAQLALSLPAMPAMDKMGSIAQSADCVEIKNALDKALDVSGMKAKGVKIVDYAGQSTKQAAPAGLIGKIKEFLMTSRNPLAAAEKGKNAFFVAENVIGHNQIHINTEKFGTAGFHEIGHAINYNNNKFLKAMQKARMPLMIIPMVLTGIALLKRKKVDGEQPKGFFDKTTTFIKENVGILSTASMLPIFAEEMIATFKGNKLAKQLLSPENYKKVFKTNLAGGATYALAAISAGLVAHLANKVKDHIAAPKEISK